MQCIVKNTHLVLERSLSLTNLWGEGWGSRPVCSWGQHTALHWALLRPPLRSPPHKEGQQTAPGQQWLFLMFRLWLFLPVLRIHKILVRIRIRTRKSIPLTNGSGCRFASCYFSQWHSRHQQKVFCLLLFEGTFTSFFKDKKSYRSHKTVGINVFLTIFAWC